MKKIYQAEPISFQKRFLHEFIKSIYIVFFIAFFIFQCIDNFILKTLLILIIFCCAILYAYILSLTNYTKIEISNSKIHFIGYNGISNTSFEEHLENVKVYPFAKGSRTGHIAYYLIFKSKNRKYYINDYLNWDDEWVIALFNDFKIAKGEKITYDEKIILKLTKY